MRIYLGFDDTDTIDSNRGTGKLARWFEQKLPDDCRLLGVVRQQLLVNENIPYTSHNSSACVIINTPEASLSIIDGIVNRAIEHVEDHFIEGSDPGVCVVCEDDPAISGLIEFGFKCTRKVVTQKEALEAAAKVHLSGHGGTNDGIIGATAAVGLTASGWCGRFIEFGKLRDFPEIVKVSDLVDKNIHVVSVDRDAGVPKPDEKVATHGWLRPMLLGNRPVLIVKSNGSGMWENIADKKNKQHAK
ncbi:MAG: hypothetical protein JW786_15280 [Desulfobacterales bacterium]|nr:hypothetical protein [Desulfobacterales bacterium]